MNDDYYQDSAGDDTNGRLAPRSAAKALDPREVPPPPKRSRQARHGVVVVFNAILSLLVFFTLVASGVVYFGKLRFEEPGPLQTTRTVVIREGSSLARIADQLEFNGVIDNEFVFRLGVRGYRASGALKAGEYAFEPRMSMYDVMETIRTGRGVLHKITFPEGLTSHQMMARLAEDETLVGDLPDVVPPEGSLMPDTYPFQRGTTRREIVERMRVAHDRMVEEIWEKRIPDLPVKDINEFVTLASIVEKETGRADERSRVAAVFINRLKKGMRLQSDPTILYGLFGGEGRPPDRPILRSDITKPTPYNTYVIDGLPPGPIASPGRASLEAVANPSRTDELFFVADGTGGHVFAKTLAEHEENVRRWRIVEKRLREAQRAREEQQAKEAADAEEDEAAATSDESAEEPAATE